VIRVSSNVQGINYDESSEMAMSYPQEMGGVIGGYTSDDGRGSSYYMGGNIAREYDQESEAYSMYQKERGPSVNDRRLKNVD
jgi:hypothetical protein